MENLQAMFGGGATESNENPVNTGAVVTNVGDDRQSSEKKKTTSSEVVKQVKEELKEELKNDPGMAKALRSLSGSIEITRILGYGVNNNIIKNKEGKTKINEKTNKEFVIREATSANVGVVIKNIGTEAIDVQTEVYQQNEAGVYVGTPTVVKLVPGQEMQLTRKYLTLLASKVEFSMNFANGKLVAGHSDAKGDFDEYLSSFYFRYTDPTMSVNDDNNKTAIDIDVEGRRVVTEQYVATFGYLNNAKTSAKRPKADRTGLTSSDILAAYIRKISMEKGI